MLRPEAAKVLRQRRGRLVASLGILVQRGEHDEVEVPAQLAPQRLRGAGRRPGGLLLAHDARELHERLVPDFIGVLPGEEHVEQHAQGVDVGGGAHRLAPEPARAPRTPAS